MHDDWLKRWIHFAVGFVLGGGVCGYLSMRIAAAEARGVEATVYGDTVVRWGWIGGLVGGVAIGLLAMWQTDRFWAWFQD